jgi:tetratricopeptide (TPR) repeat protein
MIIFCGKSNNNPYYIKEADLNIKSIQELAYFIYNYVILISNSFITKNLILYIDSSLKLPRLASDINEMYNKKANLSDILIHILANSNYYSDEEITAFRKKLLKLLSLPEEDYILNAGDKLFQLKKYERAIAQYGKIAKTNNNALLRLAQSYAKLQFYEIASDHFAELYKKTKSTNVLKEAYFCLKLNGTVEKIRDIEPRINENLLADWEYDIVSKIIKVRRDETMKEYEDIFLMGSSYIKENIEALIKKWKGKYRYIG